MKELQKRNPEGEENVEFADNQKRLKKEMQFIIYALSTLELKLVFAIYAARHKEYGKMEVSPWLML